MKKSGTGTGTWSRMVEAKMVFGSCLLEGRRGCHGNSSSNQKEQPSSEHPRDMFHHVIDTICSVTFPIHFESSSISRPVVSIIISIP